MPISLRNYLYGYQSGSAIIPGEFTVWNTNTTTNSNGGQCCLWTVPAGAVCAVFEIWSGGGSGGGSCCCVQGGGAGSGGYAIKSCTVAAGQQIRICAAGSGCCMFTNEGECGCCSFVCSLGGAGQPTWLTNVPGGHCVSRPLRCNYFSNCYTCCSMCYCCGGVASNADFFVAGTVGSGIGSQYCYGQGHQYAANAPFAAPGPRIGPNGCCGWGGDQGFGIFPGGGGISAQLYGGGCCCGGPGAGGMVYVMYF
jgi:hypothetical protein